MGYAADILDTPLLKIVITEIQVLLTSIVEIVLEKAMTAHEIAFVLIYNLNN